MKKHFKKNKLYYFYIFLLLVIKVLSSFEYSVIIGLGLIMQEISELKN